jgi:hypothetical protein
VAVPAQHATLEHTLEESFLRQCQLLRAA